MHPLFNATCDSARTGNGRADSGGWQLTELEHGIRTRPGPFAAGPAA